jgi:hypothetical protein
VRPRSQCQDDSALFHAAGDVLALTTGLPRRATLQGCSQDACFFARPDLSFVTPVNCVVEETNILNTQLRLAIYEFATYVDKPIKPEQVTDRSNKFIWGDYQVRRHFNQPGAPGVTAVLESKEQPLAVTHLGRSCRQVHDELVEYPVFYRVNRFQFKDLVRLHQFLAALSPERRAMLTRIELDVPNDDLGQYLWPTARGNNSTTTRWNPLVRSDILVLLTQCTALREFKVTLSPWTLPGVEFVGSGQCLRLAEQLQETSEQDAPFDVQTLPWTFFNLPCLSFVMSVKGRYGRRADICLSDGKPIEIGPFLAQGSPSMNAIQTLNRAKKLLFSHRERMATLTSLTGLVSPGQLEAAIQAAGLDFHGEVRISRDRTTMIGPISRRTRSRVQESTVSEWGTIATKPEKYDKEGLLTWDIESIRGVRWHEGNIQCQVVACGGEVVVWEELHAILEPSGMTKLRYRYDKVLEAHSIGYRPNWLGKTAPSERTTAVLTEYRALVPPKDILDHITATCGDHASGLHWTPYVHIWKRLVRKWNKNLDLLSRVEAAQKAREAKKKGKGGKVQKSRKATKSLVPQLPEEEDGEDEDLMDLDV